MRRVIVESPYAGDIERNTRYLRACLRDCLLRGEAPFASHAIFTQPGVLRDEVPEERTHGIGAGFAWHAVADAIVFYVDLGVSSGMRLGARNAGRLGIAVEQRELGEGWDRL